MEPTHADLLDQAIQAIALHLFECGMEMTGAKMTISGQDKTFVALLIDTSLAPLLWKQLGIDESSISTAGPSTPAGPPSQTTPADGLPPWLQSGKKGIA